MRTLLRLWHDDGGNGLITAEWLFLFTTLVVGSITGLVAVRQALVGELTESAQAILSLHEAFSFSGQTSCQTSAAGSAGSDSSHTITSGATPASSAAINQSPLD